MALIGIYKIQSKSKPERIYIGSSSDVFRRWSTHKTDLKFNRHSSLKLQRHVNKYGIDDLIFYYIIGCDKEDLIKLEQFFIDCHRTYFNCNLRAGSSLGRHWKLSKEQIKRMSERFSGSKHPNFGKHCSEETKQKIREANFRNGNVPPSQLGRRRSEETKQKIKDTWELKRINKLKINYN